MSPNIPERMLAVGVHENNDQLAIKSVPVPIPGPGEVLVKIAAAPINPSDIARIRQLDTAENKRIFIAGIEGSGRVVAYGKGILPKMLMGRRVSCASIHNYSGTWAEFMVTSAMSCVPLPQTISDEQGSMLLVNPMTAVAFFSIVNKEHHKAIINTAAASSLGRFIELLGRQNGIPVIHIVRNEKQTDLLRARGTLNVLNSNDQKFDESLKKLVVQLNATIAFDAVGGDLTRGLLMAMPYSGSVIVYGNLSGDQPVLNHRSLVDGNKKVMGFYLVNWLKEQSMAAKISCIFKARKMMKDNITVPVQARFNLNNAAEAVETYFNNMSEGKVLLKISTFDNLLKV